MRSIVRGLDNDYWLGTDRDGLLRVKAEGQVLEHFRNQIGRQTSIANDRVFIPFHSYHTVSRFSGQGLGLATAQRIVVRHGGRIRAEGRPGAGATFGLSLGGDCCKMTGFVSAAQRR